MQSGVFLGRLLGSLLKTGLSLMKNVLEPLAKSLLIPLGLIAAASATYAAIQFNIFGSSMRPGMLALYPADLAQRTTLIISNKEMKVIMNIVKSLEESDLLIRVSVKRLKMKQENK